MPLARCVDFIVSNVRDWGLSGDKWTGGREREMTFFLFSVRVKLLFRAFSLGCSLYTQQLQDTFTGIPPECVPTCLWVHTYSTCEENKQVKHHPQLTDEAVRLNRDMAVSVTSTADGTSAKPCAFIFFISQEAKEEKENLADS